MDDRGVQCNREEDIREAFISCFQNMFSTSGIEGIVEYLQGMKRSVTDSMNEQLLWDFTEEEFNDAISQMAPLKSPGPDGLFACFYQDN